MCTAQAPPEQSKPLFLQYAALEEQYGLSRSAMAVYEQAVRTVPVTERLPLYDQYLKRATEIFGIGKVRAALHWQLCQGSRRHQVRHCSKHVLSAIVCSCCMTPVDSVALLHPGLLCLRAVTHLDRPTAGEGNLRDGH